MHQVPTQKPAAKARKVMHSVRRNEGDASGTVWPPVTGRPGSHVSARLVEFRDGRFVGKLAKKGKVAGR